MIEVWSRENQWMVKTIIPYKGWTVVWLLKYVQIKCKNNKPLVRFIDKLIIQSVQVIIKNLILIRYILAVIFGWFLKDK